MKVYVSELPKDCIECPFCQDIKVNAGMDRLLFCKANKGKAIKNIEKSFDKCIVKNEFQSLSDYTKQVRKDVVGELIVDIRSLFNSYASSLIDYCIWNKNSDKNQKLYNNFKRVINSFN